jgi:radical SAM protein with 4Fe4S-binding SPASM domain
MPTFVLAVPSAAELFLTSACNLHCLHCFAEELYDDGPELTFQEWTTLMKRLKDIGLLSLSLSGGEIFTRGDALDIIAFANGLGFCGVSLVTNGCLVTSSIAHALARYNLKRVLVSLDGVGDVHNRVRGHSTAYERTITGVGNLVDAGTRVAVQFTAMKCNYRDLPRVAETVFLLGVRALVVNRLTAHGRARQLYPHLALDQSERIQLNRICSELRSRFQECTISYSPNSYDRPATDNFCARSSGQPKYLMTCSAATSSCAVTPSGWVLPCSLLPGFRAGNVRDRDVLDIWSSSAELEQIRQLTRRTLSDVQECTSCDLRASCTPGCRGNAYNLLGALISPDPDCPFWSRKEEISKR